MRKMLKSKKGFTLIELIMVITILALIGVVAIPEFVDFETDAKSANEIGVAGGVQAGITTYFVDPTKGNRTAYPTAVGGGVGVCSQSNPCFGTVLAQGGVSTDWEALTTATFRSPVNATNVWTYDSDSGSFTKTTP